MTATTTNTTTHPADSLSHPTYRGMISEAISALTNAPALHVRRLKSTSTIIIQRFRTDLISSSIMLFAKGLRMVTLFNLKDPVDRFVWPLLSPRLRTILNRPKLLLILIPKFMVNIMSQPRSPRKRLVKRNLENLTKLRPRKIRSPLSKCLCFSFSVLKIQKNQ